MIRVSQPMGRAFRPGNRNPVGGVRQVQRQLEAEEPLFCLSLAGTGTRPGQYRKMTRSRDPSEVYFQWGQKAERCI